MDKDAVKQMQTGVGIEQASKAIRDATISKQQSVALPNGFALHDIEHIYPNRLRLRGTMETPCLADFAEYLPKDSGAKCFVDHQSMRAIAVINMGTVDAPGHADDTAEYKPTQTAAYAAVLGAHGKSSRFSQREMAEWLEDWIDELEFFNADQAIDKRHAITAIRNVDIAAATKHSHSVEALSESRSAFDSVTASSANPLPTLLYFKCLPYTDLDERNFVLRLHLHLSSDKPQFSVTIQRLEQHRQDMAAELADKVRAALPSMPVFVGSYAT